VHGQIILQLRRGRYVKIHNIFYSSKEVFLVKINFSLSVPWRIYMGSGSTALHILNVNTRWRWWLTVCPGCFSPHTHWAGGELPDWTYLRRDKSIVPTKIRTPDRPTYSPISIPTTLTQIHFLPSNEVKINSELFIKHLTWFSMYFKSSPTLWFWILREFPTDSWILEYLMCIESLRL